MTTQKRCFMLVCINKFMIGVNELKSKVYFIFDGQPWVVLESNHLKMQQRRPVVQTRIQNLLNGKIIERNFQQSDTFEVADVSKKTVKFIYEHRGEYWFSDSKNPSDRFQLSKEILGDSAKFLKPNLEIDAVMFNDDVINIELPVKIEYKVKEAPPAVKGDTAQGGVKQITLEGGAVISAPLFINAGDIVRVNTETGQYVERVDKK
ncbi:MAG: elongation factor P [Candidatus Yanofskybacteria bacterium CG10_big_fil_rev_8_21_14_0_10_36_16]|uniref:Elongation factor P n=1 Tax=Candidatus Yanofskybacteria bacterium CG10_big_fil_rev_8_21_14_0_10_36_16 TaxID=1975096 RepID=A0A2J0QA17_9BACT|nr:MAG: elongation factor P [Candidatus Yanofskybacteria bacterium CG10_big_fil_rev_8_21_14_0_10_36_16]